MHKVKDVFYFYHLPSKRRLLLLITKASEASWSYSCDSKVSFDRVQILTPDFLGRSPPPSPPPPLPTSPLLLLVFLPPPPSLPPSLLPLRKFDSLLSSLFGMRLALRILRPHSLTLTLTLTFTLTLTLTVSLSLSLSSLSHLSLISLISPSSLSHLSLISLSLSLSLSSLSLVFPSLFSLFSRRRIRAKSHIERTLHLESFAPPNLCKASCLLLLHATASKKSAVFFPTSLPSTFPFWSASFRPPLGLK